MTSQSCYIWKKRTVNLIVVFAILLVFFGSGCNTISPKLQDEYIRPGLSPGMCGVVDKYRQLYPEMMVEREVPGLSIALVDREGILWTAERHLLQPILCLISAPCPRPSRLRP